MGKRKLVHGNYMNMKIEIIIIRKDLKFHY